MNKAYFRCPISSITQCSQAAIEKTLKGDMKSSKGNFIFALLGPFLCTVYVTAYASAADAQPVKEHQIVAPILFPFEFHCSERTSAQQLGAWLVHLQIKWIKILAMPNLTLQTRAEVTEEEGNKGQYVSPAQLQTFWMAVFTTRRS